MILATGLGSTTATAEVAKAVVISRDYPEAFTYYRRAFRVRVDEDVPRAAMLSWTQVSTLSKSDGQDAQMHMGLMNNGPGSAGRVAFVRVVDSDLKGAPGMECAKDTCWFAYDWQAGVSYTVELIRLSDSEWSFGVQDERANHVSESFLTDPALGGLKPGVLEVMDCATSSAATTFFPGRSYANEIVFPLRHTVEADACPGLRVQCESGGDCQAVSTSK